VAVKTKTLQTSFTSGVLHPGLAGRTDIQHYYQGMSRGLNVICPKEGGARGRWGLSWTDDAIGNARFVPFSFNTEQNYLLVFSAGKMEVFREDGTRVLNINGSGLPYLVVPWTLQQALELDYSQSADTLVITHQDVQTRRIVRGATHSTWTIDNVPFTDIPRYDFNDTASPVPTSHVVDITFNSFNDGDRYKLELNGFETAEIIYSGVDIDANERRMAEELLALPPTGFVPSSITVAFTSGDTYRVTFSGDSADDYEPMTGRNTDSTGASVTTSTITPGVARREAVISATRGWPRTVTFYESRLLFGGTAQLPQALLGSQVGDFFSLKQGDGLDDQGIFVTVNTSQVNEIRALFAGRHLQMFTSGGEFYSPDRPLTPAPALPRQSGFGCAVGLKPREVDGATIFVTATRKSLREYLFLWAEEAYNATSLSVLSSHLLNDIRSFDALTSTSDEEDSYVLVVNGDGTSAILNTLRAQDIAAWTEMRTRTGDLIKQVCVVGQSIFYLVQRARNGNTVYTIERANYDTRLDSARTVLATTVPAQTGFAHLAGETVDVLVDGAPVGQMTVSAAGVLTFDVEALPQTQVEAGYFEPPIVQTMPLEPDIGAGPMLGARKRVSEIRAKVKDTLGLVANGRLIPDKVAGVTQTATPDTPFTGLRKVGDLGWTEDDAIITLTQQQPLPFHILALAGVLEVGST
jgi:hypothetical protein